MGGILDNGAHLTSSGKIHPNVEDESIKQALRSEVILSTFFATTHFHHH